MSNKINFNKLEKICSLIWGQYWQSELAKELGISRHTVSKWKTQGVAKWVDEKIPDVVRKKKNQLIEIDRSIHTML